MDPVPKQSIRRFLPWTGLAAMLAFILAAFWFLLGHQYSPQLYQTAKVVPGMIEWMWSGLAVLGAMVLLVSLRCDEWAAREWARAVLPLAAASCIILVKRALGVPPQVWDAILFSAAFGWAAARRAREQAGRSGAAPAGQAGAGMWTAVLVWAAAGAFGIYFFRQQVGYLNNLALGYADCGEYARLMFNTVANPRELFLRVNPDRPLFYDHFQPGILPWTLLWWCWPDFKLAVLLQIVALIGPAVPIYWMGRHFWKDPIAALLMALCWLAHPSVSQMIYGGSYGFHWSSVCLLLLFIALALWSGGRPGLAWVAVAWALVIKEDTAIVIGMFGVYLALFQRRRWMGAGIALAAFAYFLVVTSFIIPSMGSAAYPAQRYFSDLGANDWKIFLSPWLRPGVFWGRLLAASTLCFAAVLLAPCQFLPLKKPSVLFVGLLVFLFDCLHPTLKSIAYQYQAALLPVVFWALAEALRTEEPAARRAWLGGALATAIVLSIFLGNTFWSKNTLPSRLYPGRLALVRDMARDLDHNASLFATQRIATHFITQKYLYVDPPVPPSIDYVFLDLRDSWTIPVNMDWLSRVRRVQRQVESLAGLHLIRAEDGLVLYARQGTPLDARAVVERDALPPNAIRQSTDLGQGVRLAGFTVTVTPSASVDRMKQVTLKVFCTTASPVHADMAAQCLLHEFVPPLEEETYVSDVQPLGHGIWPTDRWLPGKFYDDDFTILVPGETQVNRLSFGFEGAILPQ